MIAVIPLLFVTIIGAVGQQANGGADAYAGAINPNGTYCGGNSTTLKTDAEEILAEINALRTKVRNGEQPNGSSGRNLSAALDMPSLNWSCPLEQQALEILLKEDCREYNLTAPPENSSYFYSSGEFTPNILMFAELKDYLTSENKTQLHVIDTGNVIYKGEPDLEKFVNLIRATTTELGCAIHHCPGNNATKTLPRYSLLCMTNQPPLKTGDIVYKGVANACPDNIGEMTNSIRKAFLNKHNLRRSMLAIGTASKGSTGFCRAAKKMPELVYDCKLEKTAYEQAKRCSNVVAKTGANYQENSWKVTRNPKTLEKAAELAVQRWWSEIRKLNAYFCWNRYQNNYRKYLGIDSFAKVASDLTTKVGCGIYNCTGNKMINAVCHYETTLKEGSQLYTMGVKTRYCTECPEKKCGGGFPGLCTSTAVGGVRLY